MATVKRIYKYRIENKVSNWIMMPRDAKILSAKLQGACMFVWAEVEIDTALEEINQLSEERRLIKVYATGQDIPTDHRGNIQGTFIDTIVMHNNYVWHLYDLG